MALHRHKRSRRRGALGYTRRGAAVYGQREAGPTLGREAARRSRLPLNLMRRAPVQRGVFAGLSSMMLWLLGALLALALVVPSVALAGAGLYYLEISEELRPRLTTIESYQPFQTSRMFDRNGTLLLEYVKEGYRDKVELSEVSPLLIDATTAIEDKNFWTNPGVDYTGIVRSLYINAVAGQTVTGASTITQQFVKLVILDDEERDQAYQRKMKEVIMAQQMTEEYSKERIMELYLNEVNYGNRAYGVQAASQEYFAKNAKDLDLNQASLLAGLPQSPSIYNLELHMDDDRVLRGVQLKPGWLNPQRRLPNGTTRPRGRQVDVLRQMVQVGMITEADAVAAVAQDLPLVNLEDGRQRLVQQAPHFIEYARQQVENDPELGPIWKNQGGLTITTTLDLRMQQLVQEELKTGVDRLLGEDRNLNNAASVIQQPGTGHILAMVGSVDYNLSKPTITPGQQGNVVDGQVNVATRERQPGSALKPFIYLATMDRGVATPGSIFWDVDTRFPALLGASDVDIDKCLPAPDAQWYCPRNYDRKWHGPVRMREALANSLNMPAVLATKAVGEKRATELLQKAGITTLQGDYGLGLALGSGEVKLVDLTTAYNTLANDGQYIAPTTILQVTDGDGNIVRGSTPQPQQVLDRQQVALIRDFMGDNAARTPQFGPDNRLNLSRPTYSKTGTTSSFRDAWTMGFTPYITVGVWGGNNNGESTNRTGGIGGAAPIWSAIMERIFATPELDNLLRNNGQVGLAYPPLNTYGLVELPVCPTGTEYGQRTTEWFAPGMVVEGNGPADCQLLRDVQVVSTADATLCLPQPGINYGPALNTVRVWNVPPAPDNTSKVVGTYEGVEGAPAAPQNVCPPDVRLVATLPPLSPFGEAIPGDAFGERDVQGDIPEATQPQASPSPLAQPSPSPSAQPSPSPSVSP